MSDYTASQYVPRSHRRAVTRSEVCLSSVAVVNESFACLLWGTEFGFLKCFHYTISVYQIITLFVGAMNPYRNRKFYLHVPFCQYQS